MKKMLKRWLIPISAAMALFVTGTVFAADTVNIKVDNTRGGYIEVYYWSDNDKTVYLPIGETSKVPKGKTLRYIAEAISYSPNSQVRYKGIVQGVVGHTENEVIEPKKNYSSSDAREYGQFQADTDMTISGEFKGQRENKTSGTKEANYILYFKRDDDYYLESGQMKAGKFSDQIYLYNLSGGQATLLNDDVTVKIKTVTLDDSKSGITLPVNTFQIDETGRITSSDSLETGKYTIQGSFSYQGKTKNFFLTVNIGSRVDIYLPLCFYKTSWNQLKYGEHTISEASPL